MINRFINKKAGNAKEAVFLVALSYGLSALMGILRDRMLANRFGGAGELDPYFAAFRIPDFIYAIAILGGLSAAFLPVFSETFSSTGESAEKESRLWPKQALALTNNVLTGFSLFLVVVSFLFFLFIPKLAGFLAPGFSGEKRALLIGLSRIMLLSPIIFGISSVFSGILHYFNRFLAYSLAPVLYNLGIILGIVFLSPSFGLWGIAYGVIFGALLHLLVQLPSVIDAGWRFLPSFNFKESNLLRIFALAVPRVFGQASYQFNLFLITAIASTFDSGSISVFNFSNNLQSFPASLIGASFAVASFPYLSRYWAAGRRRDFFDNVFSALKQIAFLALPVSVFILVFRAQIVRLVLGSGNFGWQETRLTAASLGVFSLAIAFQSLIPLISRSFFAAKDTKTPAIIAVASIAINLAALLVFSNLLNGDGWIRVVVSDIFKLWGINNIRVLSLPLAVVFSSFCQLFFLISCFLKKFGGKDRLDFVSWFDGKKSEAVDFLKKLLLVSSLTLAVAYFSLGFFGFIFNTRTFLGIFCQTLMAAIFSFGAYMLLSRRLKIVDIGAFKAAFLKKQKNGQ